MRLSNRTGSVGFQVAAALAVLICAVGLVPAQSAKDAKPATNKYVGAEKCKSCHQSEASGAQHAGWQKTLHAKAFEHLASDEAKATAKKAGVDDPQKSDKCLKCHTTAFGVAADQIKKGFDPKAGVQCETCHGPGEQHMKARFAAAEADEKAAAKHQTIPEGEIITKVDMKTCKGCHNEDSPNYKPFCMHEFSAKIVHLDPRKTRTPADRPACTCPKCEKGCPPDCGLPGEKPK